MDFLDLNELSEGDYENIEGSDGGFVLPAKGEFRFRIEEASAAPASTGTPMVTYTVAILSAADGSASEEEGKTVPHRFFPKPNRDKGKAGLFGLKRYKHFLNCIGEDRGEFDVSEHVGREFIGTIHHEVSNDEDADGNPVKYTNARITKEKPVDDGGMQASNEEPQEEIQEEPAQAPPQRQQTRPQTQQRQTAAPAKGKPANGASAKAPPKGQQQTRPQMRR